MIAETFMALNGPISKEDVNMNATGSPSGCRGSRR